MKNFLLAAAITLFAPAITFAQVTLYSQDFEGPDFDTYTLFDGMPAAVSFNQSSDNYIVRALPNSVPVGNTISGFSGNVIALEDTDDAGFFGDPFIRTNSFSISGYTDIVIEITFAAGSGADGSVYETSDFLDVDFRINGSGGWQQAHRLEGSASGKFWYDSADNGITGTGDDINIDQNAQALSKSFTVSGSTMELRITMGSRGDDEEMMFDDILVQAIVPCTSPSIASFTASKDSICFGDSVTLAVAGSLNDATSWHLYSSSCGSAPIANNSTGIFKLAPSTTTTYYVRGEDGSGCVDEAAMVCHSVSVVVNSLPSVSLTAVTSICSNDSIQNDLSGGSPIGGSYTGLGVTDNGNGLDFTFDPSTLSIGQNTITYSYLDANGCSNSATDSLEILSAPSVGFSSPGNFCENEPAQTGLSGGSPAGGIYSGSGVTDDGNGTTFGFDPSTTGTGYQSLTYDFTDINGCSGSQAAIVEVFQIPIVSLAPAADVCIDTGPFNGGGGLPAGGVYSGAGINDNGDGISYSYDPMSSGPGNQNVVYYYSDSNGCSSSASDDFEVFVLPTVHAGSDLFLCEGDSATLVGTGAQTYSWSNGAMNNVAFIPIVGISEFILTGTDTNGCYNTDTTWVTVDTIPYVYAGPDQSYCDNDSITITGSNADSYIWDNGILDGVPFVQSIGTITYVITGSNTTGCSNTDQVEITVIPLPDTSVIWTGFSATANNTNATYQWINCTTGLPVPGETNQTFANYDGYFAVEVSENGCIDTSGCFLLSTVSIQEHKNLIFNVYPNPATNKLFVDFQYPVQAEILLFDPAGRIAHSSTISGTSWHADLPNLAPGIYILQVSKNSFLDLKTVIFE